MKKILILTLFVFFLQQISAQERRLLPTEIKGENFLLKYEYDQQNKIVGRSFQGEYDAIRDSILYNPSEHKCIVYSFEGEGGEEAKTKHTYIYGKKREVGQWIKEAKDSDGTFDYIDSLGYITLTKGREWDGSWKGGPNLISYKYNNGNLSHFYLDSEYQQTKFVGAMASWEQEIFDEDISYDNKIGIFSQVNLESRWLLVSPAEEFYPMLHLRNNAKQINKPSRRNALRDFDNYQPVNVTYKYEFNKSGYPQKMSVKVLDFEGETMIDKQYAIAYKDAVIQTQITQTEKALSSGRKMLPKSITTENFAMTFTYDEQNRFTSIKQVQEGDVIRYDSIVYYPKREGYRKFSLKKNPGYYDSEENTRYKRKGNMIIMEDKDGNRFEITFTPSGMVSMMKTIKADYNPKTSIDSSVIIKYIYDKNDNLTDMYLPNNASGDRVNRNLQTIEYMRMNYDNKNGIFKHVNRDCFMILYNQGEDLNYYYYMGNNLVSMEDEYRSDTSYMKTIYRYNDDDYPIMMNQLKIEYIDAQ